MKMTKELEEALYKIAAYHDYSIENRGDLRGHNNDEDNITVSISALRSMLVCAYDLGRNIVEEETREASEFKHQIFLKAYEASQAKLTDEENGQLAQ